MPARPGGQRAPATTGARPGRPGRRGHRLATVAAITSGGVVLTLAPGPAAADPLADARTRAGALRATVERLTVEAETATEAYAAAQERLQQVVSARLSAEASAEQAGQALAGSRAEVGSRVRALYRSGGRLGMWSSVLRAPTLTDAADRLHAVERVVAADSAAVARVASTADGAATAAVRLRGDTSRQLGLERDVARRAAAVQALLGRQQALLAGADAAVLAIMRRQQAAADAAAAARAAATLRAAAERAAAARLAAARPAGGSVLTSGLPSPARGASALAAARQQIGKPYQWGGTGPDAWDCSGLTQWAYRQVGISLPRTAAEQWGSGPQVAMADLAPGDLLFWASDPSRPQTIHHVAMYAGGGRMVAAPHTGAFVRDEAVYLEGFAGAVRPTTG